MKTIKTYTPPPSENKFDFITDAVRENIAKRNMHDIFPALKQNIHGKPFVYLDSAAGTLKPQPTIDAIVAYYQTMGVNAHRGTYYLSQKTTNLFKQTRSVVAAHINAEHPEEVIFTAGTTDSFNLFVESYARTFLSQGDEVLISEMEHHANIIPWQKLVDEKNIVLKIIRINELGELDLDDFFEKLTPEVKIVSVLHISNVLGTINPLETIIKHAHKNGSIVAIDCAQTMIHDTIDVQAIDADFIAFSSNKMFGPTGVGILYGKKEFLDKMPPYRLGGGGILNVTFEKTIFQGAPHKFEVGTQHLAGVIALRTAIEFIHAIGIDALRRHDKALTAYAMERLLAFPALTLFGHAKKRVAVFSFMIDGVHPHDLGTLLDKEGVAIRVGHHCAQPLATHYGVPGSARASFAIYNTTDDIDLFIIALKKAVKILQA